MEKHYEDIIYHYCSVESFFNIITSKVLWLSDIEYMNDRLEGQWSNETFKNLDIQANAIVSSDIKQRYEELDSKKQYVFSLSENGDKLSQWRGYANDGKGIAIGFSKKTLGLSYLVNEADGKESYTQKLGLMKMIYNQDEQENLFHQIIDSITDIKLEDNRLILIKELSNKYKNPSFEEEEEVRIVYIPENKTDADKISKIKYRVSNEQIIGYHEFQLTDRDRYRSDLIPKIILGPKCTLEESDLQKFLQSYGLRQTKIQKSISSYR